MFFRKSVIAGAAALSLAWSAASASTIAYEVQAGTAGNQDYSGVLGMLFDVNSPISVLSLGVFDDLGPGITAGTTLVVELWSRSGTVGQSILADFEFTNVSAGTLIGGSRFKDLDSPLTLAAGEYAIVSYGYNGNDMNGNKGSNPSGTWSTNDGGGLLEFIGSSNSGGQFGGVPGSTIGNTQDGGPEDRYAAGTFAFTAVPLPAALPMFAAGLGILGYLGRRKKAAAS